MAFPSRPASAQLVPLLLSAVLLLNGCSRTDGADEPYPSLLPVADEADLPAWGLPVFRDEFDAGLEQWQVRDRGTHGSLSYDRAVISRDQVEVRDGMLVITGKRLSAPAADDRTFVTGYVDTTGSFSQKYGRWEMKAKLPLPLGKSQGIWPAFWLRPDNGATGGEIDIMEAYGTSASAPFGLSTAGSTQASLHFDQSGKNKTSGWTPAIVGLDTDFHIWSFEWTPEGMVWSLNGLPYKTVKRADFPEYEEAFETGAPFHMRLNLQYGSDYWGFPDPVDRSITIDEALFQIDYVRVWEFDEG